MKLFSFRRAARIIRRVTGGKGAKGVREGRYGSIIHMQASGKLKFAYPKIVPSVFMVQ